MMSNVVLIVTGHSHKQNINVRAAMVHAIGDLVQSVGILVAALVIFFKVSCRPLYLFICLFLRSNELNGMRTRLIQLLMQMLMLMLLITDSIGDTIKLV